MMKEDLEALEAALVATDVHSAKSCLVKKLLTCLTLLMML
jgi:hypothetical protein